MTCVCAKDNFRTRGRCLFSGRVVCEKDRPVYVFARGGFRGRGCTFEVRKVNVSASDG